MALVRRPRKAQTPSWAGFAVTAVDAGPLLTVLGSVQSSGDVEAEAVPPPHWGPGDGEVLVVPLLVSGGTSRSEQQPLKVSSE